MKLKLLLVRARDTHRLFLDDYIYFDETGLTYRQQDYLWFATYKTITKKLL